MLTSNWRPLTSALEVDDVDVVDDVGASLAASKRWKDGKNINEWRVINTKAPTDINIQH